jgi:ATP-dependent RNA helicase RhlE
MLDMGFLPDLKRIIKELPKKRQSLFFSATMPEKIVELSQRLLRDPVSVNVTPKRTSVELIEQRVLFVDRAGKKDLLRKVLSRAEVERAIVFTKTKRGANSVAEKLLKNGIKAAAIHGNKSQGARQRALDAFRRKFVKVLVATDVAARGIDIDGVTHVINYDIPVEPESYVHRIGRTGRAGADGIAMSFCSGSERNELRAIEKLIGMKIPVAEGHQQPASRNSDSPDRPRRSNQNRRRPSANSRRRTETKNKSSRASSPGRDEPTANSNRREGKSTRKRKQRKGRNARQRVKQMT